MKSVIGGPNLKERQIKEFLRYINVDETSRYLVVRKNPNIFQEVLYHVLLTRSTIWFGWVVRCYVLVFDDKQKEVIIKKAYPLFNLGKFNPKTQIRKIKRNDVLSIVYNVARNNRDIEIRIVLESETLKFFFFNMDSNETNFADLRNTFEEA